VNIGNRQHLRERGPNVLDVPAEAAAIEQALRAQHAHGAWPWENPWGDGHAGERIAQLLARIPLDAGVLEKTNSY
jgi:GDP/UDP-N,N'-diacetylbacillosamine 2-epimerase (hydrolysing)